MRSALLALVVVAATGCYPPVCPVTRPATGGPPFAWRVTGPNGTLIIQATHQGLDGGAVSDAAWRELDAADIYVTEAAEAVGHTPADPDTPMPLFELPPDRSLDRMLAPDDFETLQRELDLEPRRLSRMKPWVAFMLLGQARVEFAQRSMNAVLLDRAEFAHLRTIYLDTWDDQVRYLDAAITPRKLTLAIRDRDQACHLGARLTAFRAGDDSAFINDVRPGEPVIERIDRWYPMLAFDRRPQPARLRRARHRPAPRSLRPARPLCSRRLPHTAPVITVGDARALRGVRADALPL